MMDVESSEECLVSGALALALRMSRLVGVAPLQFRKARDGWRVRVSDGVHLYGQTIAILSCLLTITVFITDLMIDSRRSTRLDTEQYHMSSFVGIGIMTLVTLAGAFTGKQRMASMVENLNHVHKITLELNYYRPGRNIAIQKWLIFIVIVLGGCSAVLCDYTLSLYEAVENHRKLVIGAAYVFHDLQIVTLILLEIQFVLITLTIFTSLDQLNGCLEDLLADIKSGEIRNSSSKLTPEAVHHLSYLHGYICETVRQVDSGFGLMVLMIISSAIFHLLLTLYNIIDSYFTLQSLMNFRYNPLRQIMWGVVHFFRLCAVVEPCHRTQDAMERTKELVSQMTLNSPRRDALAVELAQFFKHLSLNETAYCPMDMFTVNRQLVVTLLSTITTYLVIVEQLG